MRPLRLLLITLLMITLGVLVLPTQSVSGEGEPERLSAYWSPRVQRWADQIIQEAHHRGIDPDFLASLVWMESRGDANPLPGAEILCYHHYA